MIRVAATLSKPMVSVMCPVRRPARGGGWRDRRRSAQLRRRQRRWAGPGSRLQPLLGSLWVRDPSGTLVVWASLAACVAGAAVAALGILAGTLAAAFAGVAGASVSLGLALAGGRSERRRRAGQAPAAELGLRSLGAAVALVVGVFALTFTASLAATDTTVARALVRVAAFPALTISFGALGFALMMGQDRQGRPRPDWPFVGIAVLLIAFNVWQLYDRLALILFVD